MNFLDAADDAAKRAVSEISAKSTILGDRVLRWMGTRFDVAQPADYFTQLQSLPLLALPWWLEESFRGSADADFQLDLIYATVNFYYFTRMLDDLMDGHPIEASALPAMHSFHLRFTRTYYRHFPFDSPFWPHFERLLGVTAETAAAEATLREMTADDFLNIGARKTAAALIPVAAVCVRYGRLDLLDAWEEMFTLFGRWHQMRDDLLDWSEDWEAGSPSCLVSEAKRRRGEGESVPVWMGREGLGWVKSIMSAWMQEAIEAASRLNSWKLVDYLKQRDEEFGQLIDGKIALAEACKGFLKLKATVTA